MDFSRPTLTISSSKTLLKMGETATISFNFSEVPLGFTTADIVWSGGGTLGPVSGSGSNFSATYTPPPTSTGGVVNLSVNAGSFTDGAGNSGYEATLSAPRYDTKLPTLLFASVKDQRVTLNFDGDIDPLAWAGATAAEINARFGWKTGSGTSFTAVNNPFTNLLVSGSTIQLALASALTSTQDAKISYLAPGGGDQASKVVQDLAGNDLPSLTDTTVDENPIIIDFAVSDIGNGNGVALGKPGEAVNVLVTFGEPVSFTGPAVTLRVRVQVGSNTSDYFDASLVTVPAQPAQRSYTFTGTLPNIANVSTPDLQLTALFTPPNVITNSTVSLTKTTYSLSSSAYTFDSLPPDNRVNSRTGLLLDASKWQYTSLAAAAAAIDGDITLETWAYGIYPGGSQTGSITLLNLTDSGTKNISLGLNNGRLTFKAVDTLGVSLGQAISTLPVDMNSWNHLAVTVDSSHALTLYVNGLPVPFSLDGGPAATTATLSAAIPSATRAHNTIGIDSPASAASAFNGIIGDLRIYNTLRSVAQIQSDMLGMPDTSGASGYYPFVNSPNWYNSTPAKPAATLFNSPGYMPLTNLRFSHDTGFSPYDLITNVSNQTVTVQLLRNLQAGEELWVSADSGLTWTINNVSVSGMTATWTNVALSPPLTLPSGLLLPTLQFKVVDAAGNDGPIVTQTYVLDTVEPVPTLTLGFELLPGPNTPALQNGVTGGATQAEATQTSGVLKVSSDSGAVVVLTFVDSASPANTVIKTITTWNTAMPVVLDATDIGTGSNQLHDGTIRVSAVATDLAGNQTFIPATTSFNLDTVAPTAGAVKQGLVLNASSKQYMALGQPASSFGDDITIETFINAKSFGGTIFDFGSSSYNNNIKLELGANGELQFTAYHYNNPAQTLTAAVSAAANRMRLNEWHHVALSTSTESGRLYFRIYLDNILAVEADVTATSDYIKSLARTNYFVGRSNNSAVPNYLDGMLAEFKVYDNARTPAQILADATGVVDSADANLRLYYPFNGSASSGIGGGAAASPGSDATPSANNLPGYRVMMSFVNDTGSSATDLITNTTNPGIVGIVNPAPAAGENLYGSVDGGTTWQLITPNGSLVKWNPTLPANSPTATTYQLRVVDLAGNSGPTSFTQTFVVDTIAPTTPLITLGTGISGTSNGATIDEATQTSGVVRVAAEAQTTVRVEFTDTATPANRISRVITGSGMANAIPITLNATDIGIGTGQLHDGTINVSVTSTDVAGNATLETSSFKLDTVAPQLFGQSLRLNAASSQYATMPYLASSSGTISGDMTLEAWIYLNADYVSDGPDLPIMALNSGAAGNGIVLKLNSQGGLVFEAYSGTTLIMSGFGGNGKIVPYKWTHVAATVNNNSTGSVLLYINAAIPSGATGTNTSNTTIPGATRSNAYIGYNGTNYFNGSIGNVRVYDYERTATQIAADLNGGADTGDANLKAWYPLSSNSSSGLTGPANMVASLAGSPAFTNIPILSLSNDTAPNFQKNSDFIFRIATQTLTGVLLYPYEAGETITINGVTSPGSSLGLSLGSRTFTISNAVFTPGSNNLRIQVSDASGNTGPECTVPYILDTVAPTNALPVGLQLKAASIQYATLPSFAAGIISGDLTLEAWINYEPVTGDTEFRTIIKLGSAAQTDLILLNLDFSSGASKAKLQFRYDTGSLVDKTFTAATVLTPNTWNHVAVTVNSSRVLTFHVNGIASGTTFTLPSTIASAGRTVNSLGGWSAFSNINYINTEFNGSIRDVRIYDNTRTLTDIQSDFTGLVDVSDQNLKAYYPLNLSAQSGLSSGTAIALTGSPTYAPKQSVFLSNDTSPDNTGNTDLVTRIAYNQLISGKLLAPLLNDESVWVSTNSGINWSKATATVGALTWSLPDPFALLTGSNTIQVKVSDLAGNDGPIVTQTYTVDTTAPVLGFINQVLALDSSKNQYVSLPAITGTFSMPTTLEAWVYASGPANDSYLFDFAASTSANNNRISLYIGSSGTESGKFIFRTYTSDNPAQASKAISADILPLNTWTHVAVVASGPALNYYYNIYLNGVLSSTRYFSSAITSNTAIYTRTYNFIGKNAQNSGYFNGYISDVRILGVVRANNQIIEDMSNALPAAVSPLGAYLFDGTANNTPATGAAATLASDLANPVVPKYKQTLSFSADTGVSATDLVTRAAAQTITFRLSGVLASDETIAGSVDNGVTWVDIMKNGGSISNSFVSWPTTLAEGTTNLKLKVSDLAGNYGPEFSIPYTKQPVILHKSSGIALGTNSYVQLPSSAANLGTTLTLEAWVLVTRPAGAESNNLLPAGKWTYIFNLAEDTTNSALKNNIILGFNTFGKLAFVGSNGYNSVLGEVSATDNFDWSQWNHVAVTVTGTTVTMYVNGTAVTTTGSFSASLATGVTRNNALIGHSYIPGDVDFNGIISDVQIYNDVRTATEIASDMNNFSTTDANLIGAYRFNGTLDSAKSGVGSTTIPSGVTAPAYFYPMSLSIDTGSYSNDFLTNIAANQTISATLNGTLAPGEKIWANWNSGSTWTDVTSFVSASQLSWSGQTLAQEGANTLQLKVTNSLGVQAGSILTQTITLDTTAPTLGFIGNGAAGNNIFITISTANAGFFSAASAILPNVATVTSTDVAKITLDFVETGNVLKTNDRLKVGAVVVNLDLSATSSSLAGTGTLGSLTGLDYTYDNSTHLLTLFKHDGSALDAASIASALGSLQFMNNSISGSSNIPGVRDFALQLIDMAGNAASANGTIFIL
ncbi:MAG: Ig-like domain-containing protein [Rhodoferax sp.]|nr:Ig-like domain-containing protein [Rhodoferax sp.]